MIHVKLSVWLRVSPKAAHHRIEGRQRFATVTYLPNLRRMPLTEPKALEGPVEKWRAPSSPFERIVARHPQQAQVMRRVLVSTPAFRELCEVYRLVQTMLEGASTGAVPGLHEAQAEYTRLGTELELDIARALLRFGGPKT